MSMAFRLSDVRTLLLGTSLVLLAACGSKTTDDAAPAASAASEPAETQPVFEPGSVPPLQAGSFRVLVTNERSGDLSVIDGATHEVLATVPLGKRPRGLKISPDGKRLYVALSGSPIAPPGTDESTLPPADKGA